MRNCKQAALALAGAVLFLFTGNKAQAQEDLFQNRKSASVTRHGFVIGFNGDFDKPLADMGKRFGLSYRVGPSVMYKTEKNWLFGAKFDFILGGTITQDSLLYGIRSEDGTMLDNSGLRKIPDIYERGYMVGLQAGKVLTFRPQGSLGVLLLTGAGFMQHKIFIIDKTGSIAAVSKEAVKGYDRLTNGIYVEQFVGINYFDPKSLINFHFGLDLAAGFTEGRRSYLYDVRRPDSGNRLDILFGIRGGLYLTLFQKKSEEIYY